VNKFDIELKTTSNVYKDKYHLGKDKVPREWYEHLVELTVILGSVNV
jgi:hypothetical protein